MGEAPPDHFGPRSYLIIGSGTFGASTALALKRAEPEADVTIVDRTPFPCRYAAGHDLNKICRGDYADIMYMKLAIRALNAWTNDQLYSQHFHNTGLLYAYDKEFLTKILANWEELRGRGNAPSYLLDPVDAKKQFGGIFSDADWTAAELSLWSPTAGWADAARALQSVIQAAVEIGANYIDSGVTKLLFDQAGTCTGAKTTNGRVLIADRIILAAGAFTPYLLAESAPDRPEVHTGKRLIAVGSPMCAFEVSDEEMEKFDQCPVMVLSAKLPAEFIPPDGRQVLKCSHDVGFSNNIHHQKSRQQISVPPSKTDQLTWSQDVPEILKKELHMVQKELLGDRIRNLEPIYYRMCWDGFTPNQDWIISPHPEVENLFILGGGSFHGFKFLPVIGELVVQMLRGELDDEMERRFAWNRPDDGKNSPQYYPTRDLGDMWNQ